MHRSKLEESERDKEQTLEMMEDLREELRRVTEDLETLACLVETERLEVETGRFLEDMRRKQLAKRKGKKIVKGGVGGKSGKHKKGKVGFWAWLFGFGGSGDDVITEEELEVMEEDERLRVSLSRLTYLAFMVCGLFLFRCIIVSAHPVDCSVLFPPSASHLHRLDTFSTNKIM